MRILIVNSTAKTSGGAEKVALTTAVALAKKGHQVSVLAAHGPIEPDLQTIPNLEILAAAPEPPKTLENVFDRIGFLWPGLVGKFLKDKLAAGSRDTVVHFHSGFLDFGIPGFRQLAQTDLPIVYTHHDYAWACPLMGFYDYTKQASCPLVGGSVKCLTTDCVNSHVDKWIRFARHLGTHQTSGIGKRVVEHVFVSRTSMDKIAPYLPSSARRTILPNPADFPHVPAVDIAADSKFAFLGRLTTEKDPLMLANATKAIHAPVRFIGDGPLFAEVQTANPDAEMTGWKSGGEVDELLNRSRALVMTSRWLEAAPLVLAESFSRGLSAIVPSETAAAEFVEDGANGFVYESRNQKSLEGALTKLLDASLAKELGGEAYRRFWANPPNWEAHLNGLEAIYGRAIGAA